MPLPTRSVSSLLLSIIVLSGCASQSSPSSSGVRSGGSALPENTNRDSTITQPLPIRALALVDNRRLTLEELAPALLEGAGSVVLSEYLLDSRLQSRCRERDVTITPQDLDRERRLLTEVLERDRDRETSGQLLNELRRRQALGPVRFQSLLRRNAMLRALVRDDVKVTEDLIRQTHELLYGEQRIARLIVTTNLAEADRLARDASGGADFGSLAMQFSQDVSADRGGLLSPISRADPSYPRALREALWALSPDECSSPILLESGYAILRLERIVPASGTPLTTVREEVTTLARRNQERLLMEQLARELVREPDITIFDDSLNWSWTETR